MRLKVVSAVFLRYEIPLMTAFLYGNTIRRKNMASVLGRERLYNREYAKMGMMRNHNENLAITV